MTITYTGIADNLDNSSVSVNCFADINISALYIYFSSKIFSIHWVTIKEVVFQEFLFFVLVQFFMWNHYIWVKVFNFV